MAVGAVRSGNHEGQDMFQSGQTALLVAPADYRICAASRRLSINEVRSRNSFADTGSAAASCRPSYQRCLRGRERRLHRVWASRLERRGAHQEASNMKQGTKAAKGSTRVRTPGRAGAKSASGTKARQGLRSASSAGSEGYGGQPGMGSYEQGFQAGPGPKGGYPGQIGQVEEAQWDPAYAKWRADQLARFDADYREYLRERGRFDDEFEHWRSTRDSGLAGRTDKARTGKSDGLGAIVSSTESGDASGVSAGKIVDDPGGVEQQSKGRRRR